MLWFCSLLHVNILNMYPAAAQDYTNVQSMPSLYPTSDFKASVPFHVKERLVMSYPTSKSTRALSMLWKS